MLNECLANIVGFKGCENSYTPLVYIESLPGISLKSIDNIADVDHDNFVELIDNLRMRAANRVFVDIQKGANVKLKEFSNSLCIGRIDEPLVFEPASATPNLQGIMFAIKQSKYLVLKIHNISFFSSTTQTVEFKVIDYQSNTVLNTITANIAAGDNVIRVNQTFQPSRYSTKIFVAYDGSTIGYFKSRTVDCFDDCINGCFSCDSCCDDIYGWDGSTRSSNSYGLAIDYSIQCSFERLMCENAHLFSQALLYATGIEYIFEKKGSERLNKYTTTKDAESSLLLSVFEKRYEDGIKASLSSIDLCDDCCFNCEGGIKYGYAIP